MIPGAWLAFRAFLGVLGIPLWLPLVAALGSGGGVAAYFYGKHVARQECHEAALRVEIATLKRDMAAIKAADEMEAMLQAEVEAENKQLQQEVSDYETALKARPDAKCSLTDDDLRGLNRVPGKRRK